MFFHVGIRRAQRRDLRGIGRAGRVCVGDRSGRRGRLVRSSWRNASESPKSRLSPPVSPLEILSVYHKPAPACNYAQTACQVARALAVEDGVEARQIESITVKASAAALALSRMQCDRSV